MIRFLYSVVLAFQCFSCFIYCNVVWDSEISRFGLHTNANGCFYHILNPESNLAFTEINSFFRKIPSILIKIPDVLKSVPLIRCNTVVIYLSNHTRSFLQSKDFQQAVPPAYQLFFVARFAKDFEQIKANLQDRYLNSYLIHWVEDEPELLKVTSLNQEFRLAMRKDKKDETVPFFERHLDYQGKVISASAFPFSPYSELDFKTGDHAGFEYIIANEVVKSLNMKMEVKLPDDGEWWGFEVEPGVFSGILGDLQFNRADISWGNLFDSSQRYWFMDFSSWHTMEHYCVMVPKPNSYPKILHLVLPFDFYTWIGFILSLIGITLAYSLFTLSHFREGSFDRFLFFVAAVAVRQGQILSFTLQRNSIKLMTVIFLLCMFIITYGYSSSLISLMTVNQAPPPINSMPKLLQAMKKEGMPVSVCCMMTKYALENSTVPIHREIGQRLYRHKNNVAEMKMVETDKRATINTRNILVFGQRQHLTDSQGNSRVHIMQECFHSVPIAFGLQKQSPLKIPFNRKMQQLREAGLIEFWIRNSENSIGVLSRVGNTLAKKWRKITLDNLQGIVLMAGVLLVASLMVFFMELILTSRKV